MAFKLPTPANLKNRWLVFRLVLLMTVKIYLIQIFFGVFCLFGFALLAGLDASSVFSSLDLASFGSVTNIGAGLYLLCAAGAAICGFITLMVAASLYGFNGLNSLETFSLLIAAVCIVGLLCPVLNLFPLMWLWCLYVTLANEGA